MKNLSNIILAIVAIAVGAFCIVYLHTIFTYILVSSIFFLMGYPFVNLLRKMHIGRFRLPRAVCALLVIVLFYGIVFGFVALFLPLILQEVKMIASIDLQALNNTLAEKLKNLDNFFIKYNLVANKKHVSDYLRDEITSVINMDIISTLFSGVLGALGNIFAATFSITFITFFFLTDHALLYRNILLLIPTQFAQKFDHIVTTTQHLISRYFIGILIQLTLIGCLVTIGMLFLGIKYALLLGFFAAIINIIPYIGPIIGTVFGLFVGITTTIETQGLYAEIIPLFIKMNIIYWAVHLLDNAIFQPVIFSNSIKAHPLEVFILIWVAGTLGGVLGMILAIPCYTVFRVIMKEIMLEFGWVKPPTPPIIDPLPDKVFIDD